MKQLHHFLRELDDAWKPLTNSRQALPLIGSGALMLLTDYERGTKDGDVFQTSDITDSVKRGKVEHARLVRRFEAAVDIWKEDARAEELPRYVANLHTIERDELFVPESEIDLPSWI